MDGKGNTGVLGEVNELRKTKTQLVSLNIQSAKDPKLRPPKAVSVCQE